ncbi:MAG: DUF6734 family protein [Lachnospiraceae bacterium]
MNAIHINWTKPYMLRNPGQDYQVRDYELLTTILSACTWQARNGSICMVTDSPGKAYYESIGFDKLWDGGIHHSLDYFSTLPIDADHFWAAGKIMALSLQQAPIVMIDTDFIVWDTIDFTPYGNGIATIHREEISDCYPPADAFHMHPDYQFDPMLDWTVRPCNTAFAYIGSQTLLEEYTKASISFMMNAVEPDDHISYMVFAEQRLLPMLARKHHLDIHEFASLNNLFAGKESLFTHTWGYKGLLNTNREHHDSFCDRCKRRILTDYPHMEPILKKAGLL